MISYLKAKKGQVLTWLPTLRGEVTKPTVASAPTPQRGLALEYAYNPTVREWGNTRAIQRLRDIIAAPVKDYRDLLDRLAAFLPFYESIPVREPQNARCPYWVNGWFPAIDAISLYGLLAMRNPRTYVEVGSGNSTKFARRAITDHGLRTQIVSIDPCPRAEINEICDHVIRQPCEDVDTSFFEALTADDVLFIDSSHRSFQNSDVTVFFMEILPCLPKGTVVGLHDIFLPEDYIKGWEDRYYNEQYLLAAYVFGGMDGGSILLPNWYISKEPTLKSILDPVWNSSALEGLEDRGGALWLVR